MELQPNSACTRIRQLKLILCRYCFARDKEATSACAAKHWKCSSKRLSKGTFCVFISCNIPLNHHSQCTDTEKLWEEIETLNESNIQHLQGLDENLKKQAEIYKTILRSDIVPAPTLESQLMELREQFNRIDHQLKYLEEHQRNIQMMREENYKYLMRLSNDPTGIVNHLQSFSRRFVELDKFCLSQRHLLREQQVAIECRYEDIKTLLQANNPPS